ncbi:DEAD/DEAH box helicase family protein [Burkholderia gladioli]|uniref:DEAD/DEAH box helicase family protein n=1 Tax=Burkholderia gladioli TaxID=28095 RepID=UPI001ABBD08F|nr:DEAD/DEAH box helicase family protein [Burkholderia gladioli]
MDFSKLGKSKKAKALTDPIQIFETLPSFSGTFNDLWRGQDKALNEWNVARDRQDVLVSLNTGAGKTIVGLLIAQSLINEGLQNVLYVCSTIDLVRQTSAQAKRIGIDHSTRVRREFSNDLFETGKAFCITTYSALFNGHSVLRKRFFPQAIIFDDAHVAGGLLRDSFTLRVDVRGDEELFKEIAELFSRISRNSASWGNFVTLLTCRNIRLHSSRRTDSTNAANVCLTSYFGTASRTMTIWPRLTIHTLRNRSAVCGQARANMRLA